LIRLNSNYDYCYNNNYKLNLTVVVARIVTRVSRYLAVCARLHRKNHIPSHLIVRIKPMSLKRTKKNERNRKKRETKQRAVALNSNIRNRCARFMTGAKRRKKNLHVTRTPLFSAISNPSSPIPIHQPLLLLTFDGRTRC